MNDPTPCGNSLRDCCPNEDLHTPESIYKKTPWKKIYLLN